MFHTAGHNKKILTSFLCAGYANGQKDSCEVSSVNSFLLKMYPNPSHYPTGRQWRSAGAATTGWTLRVGRNRFPRHQVCGAVSARCLYAHHLLQAVAAQHNGREIGSRLHSFQVSPHPRDGQRQLTAEAGAPSVNRT